MVVMRLIIVLSWLFAALTALAAPPLFQSNETIALTIEAPMRALIAGRLKKPEYDATVSYVDEAGAVVSVPAKIKTRGNHRLATCDFPPLRLEFDEESAAGTLFEGQARIKMVTRCDRGAGYSDWLLQEHGIYRGFNAITGYSYRVRMLDVTYQDDESTRWNRQSAAFFIESDAAVAARHGYRSIRPPNVRPDQFDEVQLMNTILYQYLIGNTDFAVLKGPSGEGCCHNGRVIGPIGAEQGWIIVPYDFDQAGIISTDYALPDQRLRIRNVRTRLYRGFCWNNAELPAAIERFNSNREAIEAALIPDDLSSSRKKRIRRYIDGFYETINDPEELQEEILDKCRGAVSFEIRKTTSAGQ